MILYLILKALDSIMFFIISWIPVFESPAWLIKELPVILKKIAGFNYYLPIFEVVQASLFIIGFVLAYKLVKIVLNFTNINLNS